MSLKELRNEFEKRFNVYLKNIFDGQKNVKVGKNKITIKKDKSIACIDFTYLNNLHAYGTIIVVKSPTIKSELDRFCPPYKSNLPNDEYIYCMSTMGEKDGCPLLPSTEDGIEKTCKLLLDRLKYAQLPAIVNLLDVNKDLVGDIISNPKCYSYPFLLILLAINRNGISKDDIDCDALLSEKTLGFNNEKDIK
ncbi:hypothetical protein I3A77_23590, partial [Salmonella enterica]|nr:hypothetical protein [Salmonella enterica subsp. enterica serovar Godesberg]MBH5290144.1 hypothetical protein [Salmonella enterica]